MAFSETLRKLATVVGLYGKESDAGYGYGDGYDDGYDNGFDGGEYGDGGYDGYGDAYGNESAPPDSAYGYANQAPPQDDDSSYQSGYGATGAYARAGARPSKPAPPPRQQAAPARPRGTRAPQRPSNVIPLREREERYGAQESPRGGYSREAEPARAVRSTSRQTTVFCARRKEDSEQIITYLVEGITVVLNLEELDDVQYRRVLDMVSGAAFALSASVIRTSQRGYLIAPEGTVIVDEQREADPRDARDMRDGHPSRW